jgi:mono/diheme cytochrome c family protein
MKAKLKFLMSILLITSWSVNAQDEGASLFKKNCGVCHTVGKGKLVGPDLKGSHEKYKEDWLIKWIQSSQALVKKGDKTAVKIFEENNKLVMPDQTLPESEIKTILGFIKSESEKPVDVVSADKPKDKVSTVTSAEKSEPYDYKAKDASPMSWRAATFVLAGFCVVLVIVVIALANTIGGMAKTFHSPETDTDHPTTQV